MGTEEQYDKLIDTIIWLKKILASLEKKRKEFKFDWQNKEG